MQTISSRVRRKPDELGNSEWSWKQAVTSLETDLSEHAPSWTAASFALVGALVPAYKWLLRARVVTTSPDGCPSLLEG